MTLLLLTHIDRSNFPSVDTLIIAAPLEMTHLDHIVLTFLLLMYLDRKDSLMLTYHDHGDYDSDSLIVDTH